MFVSLKGIRIRSIISAIPSSTVELKDFLEISQKEYNRIVRRTGITKLRKCDQSIITSDFCVPAAEKMIESEGLGKDTIDGLVMVTQKPDYLVPATAYTMQKRLNLSKDTICVDVTQGCTGYVNGLFLASMLVSTKACRRVLLCVGDAGGRPKAERGTDALFGDAGTATLVEQGEGEICYSISSYGMCHQALMNRYSGFRNRYLASAVDVQMTHTEMDGMSIMQFSLETVPDELKEFLAKCDLQANEVDLYAVHQADKIIVDSLASLLSVSNEKMPFMAGEIGNTSSASIPLLLSRLEDDKSLKKVVLCGFGVGLSFAAAYLSLEGTRFYGSIEI